jgi:hypothetical protein
MTRSLPSPHLPPGLSRRDLLTRLAGGFGAIGLSTVLADAGLLAAEASAAKNNPLAPKAPHYPPRAKRLIFLFMNGGPSHVDTFDPKPVLNCRSGEPLPESLAGLSKRRKKGNLMGSPFAAAPRGESGIEVSELYPEISRHIDDLCVVRSMWTDTRTTSRASC